MKFSIAYAKHFNKILLSAVTTIVIANSAIQASQMNNNLLQNVNTVNTTNPQYVNTLNNHTDEPAHASALLHDWEPSENEKTLKRTLVKINEKINNEITNFDNIVNNFKEEITRGQNLLKESKKTLDGIPTDINNMYQRIGVVKEFNKSDGSYNMNRILESVLNTNWVIKLLNNPKLKEIIGEEVKPQISNVTIEDILNEINNNNQNITCAFPKSNERFVEFKSVGKEIENIKDKESVEFKILTAMNDKVNTLYNSYKYFTDDITKQLNLLNKNRTEIDGKANELNENLKEVNSKINECASFALNNNATNKYLDKITYELMSKANNNLRKDQIKDVLLLDLNSGYEELRNTNKSNNKLNIKKEPKLIKESNINGHVIVDDQAINTALINLRNKLRNFIEINKRLQNEYYNFQKTINNIDTNAQVVLNNKKNLTTRIGKIYEYERQTKFQEISKINRRLRIDINPRYNIKSKYKQKIDDLNTENIGLRKQKDGLQAVVEQWRPAIQEINKQKNIPSNQYMNKKRNLHSTELEENNNNEQENKINFEDIKQKDKNKINKNNKANKNYNNINRNESSDSEDGMSVFNESWRDDEQLDNINKNSKKENTNNKNGNIKK